MVTGTELILATYPFLVAGALGAAGTVGYALWKTRDTRNILWLLLIGVFINMVTLAIENLWFGIPRFWGERAYQVFSYNAYAVTTIKLLHAFGAWFHFWAAIGALLDKDLKWVIPRLSLGALVFFPTYATFLWLFTEVSR